MEIGISNIVAIVLFMVAFSTGKSNSPCDIQPCFTIYNNLRTLFSHIGLDSSELADDDFGGANLNTAYLECSLRKNLTHCMKREEKRCRGDLNYHSLGGLIKRLRTQHYRENCSTAAMQQHGRGGSFSSSSSFESGQFEEPILPATVPRHSTSSAPTPTLPMSNNNNFGSRRRNHNKAKPNPANLNINSPEEEDDGNDNMKLSDILLSKGSVRNRLISSSEEDAADDEDEGWNLNEDDDEDDEEDDGLRADKCVPKSIHSAQRPVGCALYGLTNLKSFHDPLNFTDFRHCSLTGSWSLIDTPEFAVQITNKEGYPPMPKDVTMTTLVTVILKHNDCSQRKTYQATYDEVPGMFTDGSSTAGTVRIETIIPSEHVRINMHYFLASIDIVKVVGQLPIPSLSITIKMPQVNVTSLIRNPSQINGLPLCFYGCPKIANLLNVKPRSVSSYKCTPPKRSKSSRSSSDDSSREEQSDSPPSREEFLDTSTSINAAICDSLLTVQNILGDKTTILKEKLSFPGEESNIYATLSEQDGNGLGRTQFSASTSNTLSSCRNNNYYSLFIYSILLPLLTWLKR